MKALISNLLMTLPKTILCYGDSLTAGTCGDSLFPYATQLQKELGDDIKVFHCGLPGWTALQMLDFADDGSRGLKSLIKKINPQLVILLAGTNDLGFEYSTEQISENIQALHNICHQNAAITLAVGIPPSAWVTVDEKAGSTRRAINEQLSVYCDNSNAKSFYTPFPFEYERNGANWSSDGLHFSEEGYKQLGSSLSHGIRQKQRL